MTIKYCKDCNFHLVGLDEYKDKCSNPRNYQPVNLVTGAKMYPTCYDMRYILLSACGTGGRLFEAKTN